MLQAMRQSATTPGLKQEQLKYNLLLPNTLRCSLHKHTLQDRLSVIFTDAYFCKIREKDHLITYK